MKTPTLLKKLVLSTLLAIFLSSSAFVPIVRAQQPGPWYNQSFPEWYSKVYDPNDTSIFGERYTAAQVQWVFYSLMAVPFHFLKYTFVNCVFTGNLGNCIPGLTGSIPPVKENAMSTKSPSIVSAIFEDRPLSGITYVKNLGRKFHLIPEAQAQTPGFGFGALDPILPMWRASRNIAYSLLVLVTLVFAFMIMFRVKISPQVVITVQSALPKLVITIILVTFSYAIAGFLVDLMYVVIGLASLLIANFSASPDAPSVFNALTRGQMGLFGLFLNYFGGFLVTSLVVLVSSVGVLPGAIAVLSTLLVGLLLAPTGLTEIAFLLGALIVFLVFIALVWHFFKILWMLLKAFANILLLTIFAPFQIIFGALVPALGFGTWLKSMASNLSVFIITGVLFQLANIFMIEAIWLVFKDYGGSLFANIEKGLLGTFFINNSPTNPSSWPPLLGTGTPAGVALVMLGASFVIFTLIPKTADMIQSFIQGKPFAYGTAIGEALGLGVFGGKQAGLYGAGEVVQRSEEIARGRGQPPPVWTQVARRTLGIRK